MLNKVRKQMIGNKEYSFKMTNRTIRRVDEEYGNYATVIYGLMEAKQFYTNSLKLVSMCCLGKEWKLKELENKMSPQQYQDITQLAVDLYLDYMGLNEDEEKESEKINKNKKEKN